MAVIGFLRLDDFLSELDLERVPVRIEAFGRSSHTTELGLEWYDFFVEAAAERRSDTLVFRLPVGRCQVIRGVREDQVDRLHDRGQRVARLLRGHLENEDYDVRAGVIAAADESKTGGALPDFIRAMLQEASDDR